MRLKFMRVCFLSHHFFDGNQNGLENDRSNAEYRLIVNFRVNKSRIHKPGNPLRPIVSTCGSPTYELAKYVAKQLVQYSGNTKSFVKNSERFIEVLQQQEITKEDLLVSYDVESLFTNAQVKQILEIIKQQLIPKGLQPDLINLARLCLSSTYFLWNGEFYEQASGVAMASPLLPVIAKIFMEAFEHEAMESSRMKPKC
ncbi:hypothetical protein Trydic_g3208 [Trypoxylus dichotomus]